MSLIGQFDDSCLMDLPRIRTVVSDPSDPDGDRLVLLRMSAKGMNSTVHFVLFRTVVLIRHASQLISPQKQKIS